MAESKVWLVTGSSRGLGRSIASAAAASGATVMATARRPKDLDGLVGEYPGRVRAVALGSHGDEMVIPLSQATVAGGPLADRLPPATLTALVDRTRDSGAEVVGLLTSGSAFMAPGTSAAHMVLAMARGSREVVPATVDGHAADLRRPGGATAPRARPGHRRTAGRRAGRAR